MKSFSVKPMPATPDRTQALGITSTDSSRWRIARTPAYIVAFTTLASLIVGCAGETGTADEQQAVVAHVASGTTDPTIFGGTEDDDASALGSVVALRVGANGTFELCSGSVLAPNLVLTARHCVTKNLTSSVACDENGRSANGQHVAGDQEPSNIGVYVGATPSFSTRPSAVAKAVVAPQGPYLCDSDIALVVLDRPLDGVKPLPVRLGAAAREGETIRSVGYGQNDEKMPIGTRFRRAGVEVLAMGQTVSASKTPLGPHEFEVGKSICQGDSGGPAISEITGAVIGVVSRGGNCDQDFGHIYTTTAGFEDLFDQAFALAKANPVAEPAGVAPTNAKPASAPAATADDSAAPASGGCSTSSRSPAGGSSAVAIALAAMLVLRGRRRS